ncbi:tigger transposable element-derived protein 1 [Trichonephila clavipes]|nr:tigger transposable element-derived protein 1 [Trichonephila clavipes]
MANAKAWMATAIFTEWFNNCFVPEVEAYMKEKSLDFKVLLIVDNAASHPQLEHPNVQLVFLPPNTTSLIQPLDQGIIATFKKYYVKAMHKFILNKLENESLTVKNVWKQSLLMMKSRNPNTMARTKRLSLTECVNLLRRLYENGPSGGELSCSYLDSDENIRLRENDCEKSAESTYEDDILVNLDICVDRDGPK